MTFIYDRIWEHAEDFTSSSVDVLYHNRETNELGVEFHSSGTIFVYDNVLESAVELVAGSDSVGSNLYKYITGDRKSIRREQRSGKREVDEVEDTTDESIHALIEYFSALPEPTKSTDEKVVSDSVGSPDQYSVTYIFAGEVLGAEVTAYSDGEAISIVRRLADQIGLYDVEFKAVTRYLG